MEMVWSLIALVVFGIIAYFKEWRGKTDAIRMAEMLAPGGRDTVNGISVRYIFTACFIITLIVIITLLSK